MGFLGWRSLGCPSRRPYQATPAFSLGLCAAYSHTILPPQQNPVMPSLDVSPLPDFCAQATTASRSDITSASGTLETTFEIISLMSGDRKSTRLNSSHRCISYAVFCLKKKKKMNT